MSQEFVNEVERICAEVLSPLVEGDGGQLWIVAVSPALIQVHLSGTCSGCPGATLAHEHFIAPAVRVTSPTTVVRTTNGAVVPEGARRIRPPTASRSTT